MNTNTRFLFISTLFGMLLVLSIGIGLSPLAITLVSQAQPDCGNVTYVGLNGTISNDIGAIDRAIQWHNDNPRYIVSNGNTVTRYNMTHTAQQVLHRDLSPIIALHDARDNAVMCMVRYNTWDTALSHTVGYTSGMVALWLLTAISMLALGASVPTLPQSPVERATVALDNAHNLAQRIIKDKTYSVTLTDSDYSETFMGKRDHDVMLSVMAHNDAYSDSVIVFHTWLNPDLQSIAQLHAMPVGITELLVRTHYHDGNGNNGIATLHVTRLT